MVISETESNLSTQSVLIYTKKELMQYTGLPLSTLNYRLKRLGIVPDRHGYYHASDLAILKSLDNFLAVHPGGGIKLFLQTYNLGA